MELKQTLIAALELLHELDADPRHPAVRELDRLIPLLDVEHAADDPELTLIATIQPGGVYSVKDQHGRPLRGVSSVAVFKDQHGRDVMQVNL